MHKVFIDGQAGTTGLEIAGRIRVARRYRAARRSPKPSARNSASRRAYFEAADLTILCLPDDAAREAVALAPSVRILDASTAHRTADGWVYGLPELEGEATRDAIRTSRRVSNPGCYPTGFILLIRPLIDAGIVAPELPLRVNAVSGYSGGGKAMIAEYSARDEPDLRVRPYGLHLAHKHVPEMRCYSGTRRVPLFAPMVGHFFKGMLTQVPLFLEELENGASAADVCGVLTERYVGEPFVHILPLGAECAQEAGFLGATACNDTNRIELMVFAGSEHVLLSARYDNLGKGAAGAAVQNMNLMLGVEETAGLTA